MRLALAVSAPAAAALLVTAPGSAGAETRAGRAVITPQARLAALETRVAATETKLAEIDALIDQMKSDIDSMSAIGEMEKLRLQMTMDRPARIQQMLSNIQKKTSDTSDSITRNVK